MELIIKKKVFRKLKKVFKKLKKVFRKNKKVFRKLKESLILKTKDIIH